MTIKMKVIDLRTSTGLREITFKTYEKAGNYTISHYDKIFSITIYRGDFTFFYNKVEFMEVLKRLGFRKEVKI